MAEGRNPRVGFVILVWNSEKVIGKCLSSIRGLKLIDPYAVIVDNGSHDNSLSIVDSFIREAPSIFDKIHYDVNKGTTVSRNDGLKKLLGKNLDYYCILDSDTEISDEAFCTLVNEMEQHAEYGIIGPTMVTSGGLMQISARSFPTVMEKIYKAIPIKALQVKGERMERQSKPGPNSTSYPVDYLMSACWLIRPDTIKKAGMLDERIFYAPEDAEYCIRVWKSGYQVAFCSEACIIHEWQRLSKRKLISKINWEHIKGLCYMFRKHHYCFTTRRLKETFGR